MQTSNFIRLLFIGLCVFGTENAFPEIFRWTDNNGKVHFSDKAPIDHKSESIKVRLNTYESVSYDTSALDTGEKVVLYSTSWCTYCEKARQYFTSNGISFTEYDVEKNPRAKSEFQRMGAKGVPVILVGKKRMNGFSEKGFEKLYR